MREFGFAADWPVPARVRSWQTTRKGGVSQGPYASLNLAFHVGDDTEAVAINRVRLRAGLGLPSEPVWMDQVHGNRVLKVDAGDSGAADAAVTSEPGRVLAVMTADCLPVLLTTQGGETVGVAHAGWRGLAGGVIGAAVAAFDQAPSEMLAWLGPAIGAGAYEVGPEVRAAFVDQDPVAAAAFKRNTRGRWQADLVRLARMALLRSGVVEIYSGSVCTATHEADYFSHRREAPCGRMVSLIWLAP